MSGKRDHLPVESGTVWSSGHVCNAMKASNRKLVRFSKATDKFRRRKRSAYLSLSLSLLALSARCLDGRIKFFTIECTLTGCYCPTLLPLEVCEEDGLKYSGYACLVSNLLSFYQTAKRKSKVCFRSKST